MTSIHSTGIITAIFGNYDFVPPVPPGFDSAILVSDSPVSSNWQNIVITPNLPPNLAAKIPKFRPDLFLDTDISVWIDANCRDTESWLRIASDKIMERSDLAFFPHPSRTLVSEEIKASSNKLRYELINFDSQLDYYYSLGFKDDIGLFAGGVIVRKNNKQNINLGNEWFIQNCMWNTQDQISLPFVLFKTGTKPAVFDENIWEGPLSWVGRPTNFKSRAKDMNQIMKIYKAGYKSKAFIYSRQIISAAISSRLGL